MNAEHDVRQAPERARDEKVPVYDGTVFLSYARADDERPPFDETTQGWVTFFWQQLRWEMTNAGVPQARLWRDRYEIEPTEKFTEKIEAALKDAQLIVPILSTNWVSREWCVEELARFVELKPKDADKRIVLIKKTDPPEDAIPGPLRNREGYKFFVKDPTGEIQEFYWRGLQDQKAYFNLVRRIARWISQQLISATARQRLDPVAAAAPRNRLVYVAAPADELRDAWQRLVNDLEKSGFEVVPTDGRLPDSASKAEEVIRAGLGKSELAVHLLGESEGLRPDGSSEGIVRLQLRLARENAAVANGLPRVLWAPKWIPGQRDKKRDPFEVIARFGELLQHEEIYAEEVTDLSQWLRGRLTPRVPEIVRPSDLLEIWVAGAGAADDELVSSLANLVQACGLHVQPIFAGDAYPASSTSADRVALVPWGAAEPASVDGALRELLERTTRVTVLRLPGGDERAKGRFFRPGIAVERLDAVPPNRPAMRQLLARLEITSISAGDRP